MQESQKKISAGGSLILCIVILNVVIVKHAFVSQADWYALLVLTVPALLASILILKRR